MDIVSIDPRDATPIYAQLERGLRAAIATSRLRPGDQLPTVRQLAVELRVNANTVARVYGELERAGVIETRRGVGSFVSATPTQAHPPRERDRRLRAFVTRVLADADAAGFTFEDLVTALESHSSIGAETLTKEEKPDGSRHLRGFGWIRRQRSAGQLRGDRDPARCGGRVRVRCGRQRAAPWRRSRFSRSVSC